MRAKAKIVRTHEPTQAISLTVAGMIKRGCSITSIARQVGIPKRLITEWLEKDPSEASRLEKIFQVTVSEAISEVTGKAMDTVMKSIENGNSSDARWLLERLNPETFAQKQKVELTGEDGGPLRVATLSRSELLLELKKTIESNDALISGESEPGNE